MLGAFQPTGAVANVRGSGDERLEPDYAGRSVGGLRSLWR
jgi:hypothetical protein